MSDEFRTIRIEDRSQIRFSIKPGETVKIVNDDGDDIGGFSLAGVSTVSAQKGVIVLEGVPDDGHNMFIDVNHKATYLMKVENNGNQSEYHDFTIEQCGETILFTWSDSKILRSEPFVATWDTCARHDIDVRVTLNVTPLSEEHAIIVSYSIKLLSEIEAEKQARLNGRSWLQKVIDAL